MRKSRVSIDARGACRANARRASSTSRTLTAADLDSDFLRALGLTRQQPPIAAVIGNVVAGGAAERAGLQAGDEIVSIDGEADRRVGGRRGGTCARIRARQLMIEVRRSGTRC